MRITVSNDINALTKDLKKIQASAIPKATVQALNRTATGVRTDAKKALSKETGVKQKEIQEALKIKKATRQKMLSGVDAKYGYGKGLIEFVSPSKRKVGYWNQSKTLKSGKRKFKFKGVRAKAWGESKIYEGTFIGTGKSGLNVYKRTGRGRSKITRLAGPSIRNHFRKPHNQRLLESSSRTRFDKNMRAAVKNQINLAIKRMG